MLYRAALLALAASSTAVLAQNSTCHDYVIISIRGTYELQGPSIGFPGMINQTLQTIPNGIEYDAVYPAAANQTAYLGSDDVVRYITAGLENCPHQKYAILGYSQGASATMIALGNYTDPSSAAYQAIRAVLVIGNPYHIPNRTVDVDEWGGDSTTKYPGVLYDATKPGAEGIPEIYYTNGKLLDICFQEDIICAPGYPNSSFVGHLHYGETEVQDMGASFLIPRLGGVYVNMTSTTTTGGASPTGTGVLPSGTGVLPTGVLPTGVSPTGVVPTGGSPTGVLPSGTGVGPVSTGVPPVSTGVPPTYPPTPYSAASSSRSAEGVFALVFGAMAVLAASCIL